jgi:hypothetical protein
VSREVLRNPWPVLVDLQVIGCNAQYGDGIKLRVEQGARVLVLLV